MNTDDFTSLVWQKGTELYRDMPWRRDTRPYFVLVSELMLQQTQVGRVIPKFEAFVTRFPDEQTLARASLAEVLELWQGLGYNRRARFLHEAAKMVVSEYGGTWPQLPTDLLRLPGVGKNTAGAMAAYAYNQPVLFIETNIRTVYIHHFFADEWDISDKRILEKLEETLDHEHPRQFYWALMDYGSALKASGVRNIAQGKHYKKQAPLEGSVRQMRGRIIKQLTTGKQLEREVRRLVDADERFDPALESLLRDKLVSRDGEWLAIMV